MRIHGWQIAWEEKGGEITGNEVCTRGMWMDEWEKAQSVEVFACMLPEGIYSGIGIEQPSNHSRQNVS